MIVELFERRAAQHESRPAVCDGGGAASYGELNRAANRVAHTLAARLGRRQVPVAVLCRDMRLAVAAMLGTLKSANLFVPLDPAAPAARHSEVLDGAGAEIVLTCRDSSVAARRAAGDGRVVIAVDDLDGTVSGTDPGITVDPGDLACILFTSGSTGRPRGVVHEHAGLLAPWQSWSERFGYDEHDRFVNLSPLSHISSINDTLKPLLSGACMVPFRITEASPARLAELLVREGITVYHSIPSVFRALARAADAASLRFPRLRIVHLGGEPVFSTDVELARGICPSDCVVVNNLGATEIPGLLQYVIDPAATIESGIVPIGYPADGKRVFLRDAEGREVSDGEAGEIVVQSAHLARGYWNDPQATAERFAGGMERSAERTYRTGDLGRRRPDGAIEFLGRVDDQIKVRGHRVELAEVEFALQQAAREVGGIVDSTVAPFTSPVGSNSVVAYCAAAPEVEIDLDGLRERIVARLPEPMRPESYIRLESLPRTTTGKIDRRLLPAPSRHAAGSPARSPVAQQLEELWSQLLEVETVGMESDFFELGGDSMLALELATEVERVFGRAFTLPEFLEDSTLNGMSRLIETRSEGRTFPCLVPFRTEGSKEPLFVVHGLGGGVLHMRGLIHVLDTDRPFYALQARGLDGVSQPLRTIEAMAARYLEEATRVRPDGPRLLAGYSMGGVVAYEMAQQLAAAGRTIDALVLIDTGAPLPLPWKDRLTYTYLYSRLAMRRLGRGGRRRTRARYARSVSRVMRASFQAGQRYRAKPFRGNVHLISSTGGETAPGADEQERRLVQRIDRRLVRRRGLWDRLVGDGIATHEIDGHHLDLFRKPTLDLLAAELQRILETTSPPRARSADDRTTAAAVIP